MITFFAQKFGEYPFVEDKYGMSEFSWGGAMEHATNTSYGTTLVNGNHITTTSSRTSWPTSGGATVSPQTWADIWLNEGIRDLLRGALVREPGGPAAYHNYMHSLWRRLFLRSGLQQRPTSSRDRLRQGSLGAAHAAARRGRHELLQRHARLVREQRRWNGNTALYQATQEMRYGATLDVFFQQWVYGTGQPDYEYGWTTADLGNGTYRNYVRVRQTQTTPASSRCPSI
jgi:hypothetical protein